LFWQAVPFLVLSLGYKITLLKFAFPTNNNCLQTHIYPTSDKILVSYNYLPILFLTMIKKITISFFVITAVVTFGFISSAPHTFALINPGGNPTTYCGGCHSGSTSGSGDLTVTGIPASYTPGQTYMGNICITDPTKLAGGFSLFQENGSFNSGNFSNTALTAGDDGDSYLAAAGAYLLHNSPKNFDASSTACWNFSWTAPNQNFGQVFIRAAGNAVNLADGSGGDNAGYTFVQQVSEGALPVDLVDFAISQNDRNSVTLNWETATEINNDYFLIERSYNAREFEEIGKVEGAGNTTDTENYSFTDEKAELNRPIYYRLKQVDFDGAFEYSLIKKIMIEQSAINIEKVYPNPVFRSETVKVKFDLLTDLNEVEMIVYDIAGHEKLKKSFSVTKGENIINFNPNNFVSGQYFVTLISDNQRIMSDVFIVTE